MVKWFLALILALICGVASAQEKPVPVRGAVLALQQMAASLEILSGYYEARIEELKRLCGDPCKDK